MKFVNRRIMPKAPIIVGPTTDAATNSYFPEILPKKITIIVDSWLIVVSTMRITK